jgi:hypothetical protein
LPGVPCRARGEQLTMPRKYYKSHVKNGWDKAASECYAALSEPDRQELDEVCRQLRDAIGLYFYHIHGHYPAHTISERGTMELIAAMIGNGML